MNEIVRFLNDNRARLGLDKIGVHGRLTFVMVTPRFRASSHVVFIILVENRTAPVLVVKVPRIFGNNTSIDREVSNLRLARQACPTSGESIPLVIAYEAWQRHSMLIETALDGSPMGPSAIRRDCAGCCDNVTSWLMDFHRSRLPSLRLDATRFGRLVDEPLRRLGNVFGDHSNEELLLSSTRSLASSLLTEDVPVVFEHGDFGHPNILLLKQGGIGVLDWELADPQGLPGVDLFFFLTYAAFCRFNAQIGRCHVGAFRDAFFGSTAWGRSNVVRYAKEVGLSRKVLTSLFVLGWARYLSGLIQRITEGGSGANGVGPEIASWLRTNRYYALWRYALEHYSELCWNEP